MKFQLPLLLVLATSLSAVPSDINYQGRLTDANGDAVTGNVTMSVKMYDAQSGGNEIYSEDIGTVTLDENGVYSFQFGASGNSTVTKTETIVTSDGTSTEYTGTFTSTPIDGTISVTDETYSWNDIDGNPGEQATAYIIIINGFVIFADLENGGSGYDDDNPPIVTITGDGSGASATATVENGAITGIVIDDTGNNYTEGDIVIAPPPAPFTVDKVDGNLEVGYASSPSNGTGVVATYKTLEQSIIGALTEASSHWLELTVDGTAQNPRERILSVPFAQVAGKVMASERKEMIIEMYGDAIASDQERHIFRLPTRNFITGGAYYYNNTVMRAPLLIDNNEILDSVIVSGRMCDVRIISSYVDSNFNTISEVVYSKRVGGDISNMYNGGNLWEEYETHIVDLNLPKEELQTFEVEVVFEKAKSLTSVPEEYKQTVHQLNAIVYKVVSKDFGLSTSHPNLVSNSGSSSTEDPFKNSTFSIIEGSFTWHEAKVDAESRGGRLAVLDTGVKLSQARASIGSYESCWIGLSDELSEGNWIWVNGTSLSFSDWINGEPTNISGDGLYEEHFVEMVNSYSGKWNDVSEHVTMAYLLEMPQE